MKKVYRYEGEYGVLEVDLQAKKIIKDELDREKIREDAKQGYWPEQSFYGMILEELFGEDVAEIFPPRTENEYWCGSPTDYGFCAFNDEIEIIIDAEGADIYERNEWMEKNWIELVEHVGDFQGMELWQAICHHDGYHTEGWALVGEEIADFYDTDPRKLPEEDLLSGYRLPAYMPGYCPEQG